MEMNTLWKMIIFLSLLGILVSGYLIKIHFTFSSFCDLNQALSCSTVNASDYANVLGIPVSFLGLAFYVFVFIFSTLNYFLKEKYRKLSKLILVASVVGLFFSLYLTYAEFFLIKAVCILCLISLGLILGIVFCSNQLNKTEVKDNENTPPQITKSP